MGNLTAALIFAFAGIGQGVVADGRVGNPADFAGIPRLELRSVTQPRHQ